ncbi:ferredoxin reductase family protein [Catellatospora sichuanensis]|uniref:ferredoxin reductase family protein n=1 Tax=Catellatospora sichuanensis TaxID=1969805 RepID=UPI0016425054|nr:ferredoxin reductase family protein [Catellatospora sichuanensis]
MRRRHTGEATINGAVIANAFLSLAFAPPDGVGRQAAAELLAVSAVLLFTATLVLATRARALEPFFGGLDRMYRAHRRTGTAGFMLLAAHVATIPWTLDSPGGTPSGLLAFVGMLVLVLLAVAPRTPVLRRVITLGYGTWRNTHKLVGVFFIIGFAHTLLVDPVTRTAPAQFAVLVAAYVIGIAAFLYTVLLARFIRPRLRYEVQTVRRLSPATAEVTLRPRGSKRLKFRSGQFVFVRIHQRALREPHPFTVSSAPTDNVLRLTVKAAGDYTTRLVQQLLAGSVATLEGPYGMLDYRAGAYRQIWIAGGIGITPFLSWLRDMTPVCPHDVDLFYTVRRPEDLLFHDEILIHAGRLGIRLHLNISGVQGTLTTTRVQAVAGPVRDAEVYMCGPMPMLSTFAKDLGTAGLPAAAIHFEEFSFR